MGGSSSALGGSGTSNGGSGMSASGSGASGSGASGSGASGSGASGAGASGSGGASNGGTNASGGSSTAGSNSSGSGGSNAGGTGTGGNAGSSKGGAGGSAGSSKGGAGGSAGSSKGGAGGAAGSAGSSAGAAGAAGSGQTGMGPFPSSAPFYQDISNAPLDSQSATVMDALNTVGWGDAPKPTTLGIDFSFNINTADATITPRPFTPSPDFYSPDCDTAPVPLPPGGKGEGVDNYACGGGEDCHLFVYQGQRLYELYQSNITGGMATGGSFTATCLVVWDLTVDYWVPKNPPNFSRGDGCTGADAAGLPMTPLMLTKEDIASGNITHALRFTINNNRIAAGVYFHPATHVGSPTGGADMPPYGARLRLRGDYPLNSLPNADARTVAKALQTYGMYLADGGNIYISATIDASDLINNSILGALTPNDFEMVDEGARIDANQDCKHVPITQ
jgi:serine/threonine-protein kinase